ncbi:MAG: hypothetical protein MI920_21590 [Kiloniellales bacterium]|nr:hypothetical protein [Kiloniellales bacterium]
MANPIFDKIAEILKDFKEIKVETKLLTKNEPRHIVTKTDVIDGDTTFEIHEDFVSDKTELAALHEKQVAESKETIARTIEALADLGAKIGDKLEAYLTAEEEAKTSGTGNKP